MGDCLKRLALIGICECSHRIRGFCQHAELQLTNLDDFSENLLTWLGNSILLSDVVAEWEARQAAVTADVICHLAVRTRRFEGIYLPLWLVKLLLTVDWDTSELHLYKPDHDHQMRYYRGPYQVTAQDVDDISTIIRASPDLIQVRVADEVLITASQVNTIRQVQPDLKISNSNFLVLNKAAM